MGRSAGLAASIWLALTSMGAAIAQDRPWMDTALDPDRRAELLLAEMTAEEKLSLLMGEYANDETSVLAWLNAKTPIPGIAWSPPSGARRQSAGYVPGIARLGVPPQWQTDAGLGVATQKGPNPYERTALASGLFTAASFDPDLAFAAGRMIGQEAWLSGFNVMLAGSVNTVRDPRVGRAFEYAGEDPLLAGRMAGALVAGIQTRPVLSTVKHFALNAQETNRFTVDSRISEAAARESELLAFQIAIETGRPGSVMCAYNRYNGVYACENDWLLNDVLKGDWAYPGYVMSDWGALSHFNGIRKNLDKFCDQFFSDIFFCTIEGRRLRKVFALLKMPRRNYYQKFITL